MEEKFVLRVIDERMPLERSFLDDWLPIRSMDFQGLVGVDEPLRIARRLSDDLECEKRPRVWIVGEGMMRRKGGSGEVTRGEEGDGEGEGNEQQRLTTSGNRPPFPNISRSHIW